MEPVDAESASERSKEEGSGGSGRREGRNAFLVEGGGRGLGGGNNKRST